MLKYVSLFTCLLLAGCAQSAIPEPHASGSSVRTAVSQVTVSNAGRIAPADRTDLTPVHSAGDVVVMMDIYTLTVPVGSISKNPRFWKKIDEDHVDVPTHDLMLRNGLRYGIGPDEEWSTYFKGLFDDLQATSQKGTWTPSGSNSDEVAMSTGIEFQDLFYLDRDGQIKGRVFQHCDNLFTIAFESIPHRPTDTRVRVCAVVRDLRYGYTVTAMNQPVPFERVRPEALYDLNLEVEIPSKHFLVIAPSEVDLPFNIGQTFMVHPGRAGQVETVLVLVPTPGWLSTPAPVAPVHSLRK